MANTKAVIRPAVPEDAEILLKIYAPYVENTAITFEYEVPSIEDFRSRIENTLQRFPYIVAIIDGTIVGYAYAGYFNVRAAYDWSIETSIYVAQDCRKMGIGKQLYEALEQILKEMGILNVNACIGYPETEDEHLTKNSVEFHEHLGYHFVGEFHKCGYKFGRWYNMVWMEKFIGEHCSNQPPIRTFPEIVKNLF